MRNGISQVQSDIAEIIKAAKAMQDQFSSGAEVSVPSSLKKINLDDGFEIAEKTANKNRNLESDVKKNICGGPKLFNEPQE